MNTCKSVPAVEKRDRRMGGGNRRGRHRALAAYLAWGAAVCWPAAAAGAPPLYDVKLVRVTSAWVTRGEAINASGQVVGWTGGFPSTPWLWSDGTTTLLPVLSDYGHAYGGHGAYDINTQGDIVGTSRLANRERHACLWSDGSIIDLGTLGGAVSIAYGINDAGQIVGMSKTASDKNYHAFFCENGTMSDLGTMGGYESRAAGINAAGQVIGSYSDGNDHGFVWQNGQFTFLPTLGGQWSSPLAINDLGQVVGFAENAGGQTRPCLWEDGQVTDLGLRGRDHCTAINNRGIIAGFDDSAGYAFVFENGVKYDLRVYAGTDIDAAYDINDAGQILAKSGSRVLLLTPIPQAVGMDIKPASDPNSINLLAQGLLPVAILGSEDLDVSEIDQTTLVLGGASPQERGKSGNLGALEDVNGDGLLDLMLRFPIRDLGFEPDLTEAELTGELLGGTPILGIDSIRLLTPGDANLDGLCDAQDFSIFKGNFGRSPAKLALGDFNEDGVVDGQDFSILKSYFGQGSPSAASPIPEPAAMSLLSVGGILLLKRRRKPTP